MNRVTVRMNSRQTLRLYKDILFYAKRFPSIKRNKVVEEIRLGFRANKNLTDGEQLRIQLAVAQDGLQKLQMYTSLPGSGSKWVVNMEKQPMPQ
jgi:hypothetical protein